ncbi:MAG TPA: RnfABCDGE type electron transport complex subunit D [Candidatus Saccharimonadales bacterium]
MLNFIDSLTNKITMYRLMIYYLVALIIVAIGLSMFGDLQYKSYDIAISTLILVFSCWIINKIFANFFSAPTNSESSIITGLILALIITPNPTGYGIMFLLAASGLAIASKYLLTINRKHIFNPAAIAVVLTAIGPKQSATWWVGTAVMLPFVLIGGILIIRKIHKTKMILSFFISTTLATIVYSIISKAGVMSNLHNLIFSSSMFFLGFVMLTEPATSPTTSKKQTWYSMLVGVLLPPQVHIFSYYSSPEIALIIGNLFSYLVSPKTKLFPVLIDKIKIATSSVEFAFNPKQKLAYLPGQYMEWTLPHQKADGRGSRRYFTLASSPTESDIKIGVKFFEKGSSFKNALLDMNRYTPIVASQVSGDFVLPKNPKKRLVFIAGGIGITPYRSMIKYLLDTEQKREITLLYSAMNKGDFAYKDIFEEARNKIGLNTVYFATDEDLTSSKNEHMRFQFIDAEVIRTEVSNYKDCFFYVSGTPGMVKAMHEALSKLGVPIHQIKLDYFPGY